MSTISNAAAAAQGPAGQTWPGALAATLKRWWVGYITWRIEQAAITEPGVMSDHKLEDLGLARTQIESAVRVDRERDRVLSRSL